MNAQESKKPQNPTTNNGLIYPYAQKISSLNCSIFFACGVLECLLLTRIG